MAKCKALTRSAVKGLRVIAPRVCTPKDVAFGYDFGKMSAGCPVHCGITTASSDAVVLRVERRTSDREVAGSTPAGSLPAQQP